MRRFISAISIHAIQISNRSGSYIVGESLRFSPQAVPRNRLAVWHSQPAKPRVPTREAPSEARECRTPALQSGASRAMESQPMRDTPEGARRLVGQEAELVREALGMMVDQLAEVADGRCRVSWDCCSYGIEMFDSLTWTQHLAVLDQV